MSQRVPTETDIQLCIKYKRFKGICTRATEITESLGENIVYEYITKCDTLVTNLLGEYIREKEESRKPLLSEDLQELLTELSTDFGHVADGNKAIIRAMKAYNANIHWSS